MWLRLYSQYSTGQKYRNPEQCYTLERKAEHEMATKRTTTLLTVVHRFLGPPLRDALPLSLSRPF